MEGGVRARGENGASLVEFALVLPVFMTLLLGMLTGGIAFDRKLSITSSARESARYAATLPLSAHANDVDQWLEAVADVAEVSADGHLDPSASGRVICVAYVSPSISRYREEPGTALVVADGRCFADGRPASETRVQVVTERTSTLEALVWSRELTLRGQAVARFEAVP